jgi:hypothetical protein
VSPIRTKERDAAQMTEDEIATEAWRREASHGPGHRNHRPHLRPVGAHLMGLRGEQAFAERYGLKVDLTPRLNGDGGEDLKLTTTAGTFPVDCKAALIPKDLIVDKHYCKPNVIYVLCRYVEAEDRCELIGWQWGKVLMKSEPKDYGYGVINYWQPSGQIRKMEELDAQRREVKK